MQTQIINFSLPKKLLKTIDQVAEEEAKSRSELLREAIRNYLQRKIVLKKRWQALSAYGQKKAAQFDLQPSDVESLVDQYRQGK